MKNEMTLTYQTRLVLDNAKENTLEKYACLFNTVERKLYAEVAKGKTSASCKNEFLKQYGITARQFNACRINLEGKIAACRAGQQQSLSSLKANIETLEVQIKSLEKKPTKRFVCHQKKRRRDILKSRFASIEKDWKEKRVRLCFGGKKLFNAQYYLEQNGFTSQSEWKESWKENRNSEFFVLGSKDETAGNQTCVAKIQENGNLCLRLRLPKALEAQYGKYLEIDDVFFAYGHDTITTALCNPDGQALSYRFKKDSKGWRIFVSTMILKPETVSRENIGVIGIDLNIDHIACIETDSFGNPIARRKILWNSYGKTKEQLKALTGEVCKKLVEWALRTSKPIVIENLDFQKKKLSLRQENKRYARLLSSFAYNLFYGFLISGAYKQGIEVHKVNPAYTSVIGSINYVQRYGLSVHLAAALCIARRHQNLSEKPCSSNGTIPDGKGAHVAFVLPVRNRTKHVWHFWGQVKKKKATVLAAHHRARRTRSMGSVKSTHETRNS